MKIIGFLILFVPLAVFAKEKESLSTKDRAKNMFRSPGSERQTIDPRFQPIDHKIKTTLPEKQEEPKAREKTRN